MKKLLLLVLSLSVFCGASSTNKKNALPVDATEEDLIFTSVASGNVHTLALDNANKVYTWGNNSKGQLGNGGTSNSATPICISNYQYFSINSANDTANQLYNKKVTAISVGENYSAVLDDAGKVYIWGYNTAGQLEANRVYTVYSPTCLSDIRFFTVYEYLDQLNPFYEKTITSISVGGNHMIILTSEGKVTTLGDITGGKLGRGYRNDFPAPECLSDLTGNALKGKTITAISAGGNHSVALDSDGKVYTWGYNDSGQLGDGTTTNSNVPICISDIEGHPFNGRKITSIDAGKSHNIAIDESNNVYAWGDNSYGQLGDGTTTNSSSPICISNGEPFSSINFSSYIADGNHSSVIDSNGKMYTWGENENGDLGNNSTTNSSSPICISNIQYFTVSTTNDTLNTIYGKTVISTAFGLNQCFAITNEGKLFGWGANASGQLGNNSTINSLIPLFLGSPNVLLFVNSLFTYMTCTEYELAYAGLNTSYSTLVTYEKNQLINEVYRLDYNDNEYNANGKTYDGLTKITPTNAYTKWAYICQLTGHPLSETVSMNNVISDNITPICIISFAALSITALGVYFYFNKKRKIHQ